MFLRGAQGLYGLAGELLDAARIRSGAFKLDGLFEVQCIRSLKKPFHRARGRCARTVRPPSDRLQHGRPTESCEAGTLRGIPATHEAYDTVLRLAGAVGAG